MSDKITCPQCQTEIEVSEVMSAQLSAGIRQQFQIEFADKAAKLASERDEIATMRAALEESRTSFDEHLRTAIDQERDALVTTIRAEATQAVASEMADRDEQLSEAKTRLKNMEGVELDLRRKARELEEQCAQQTFDLARKLDEERKVIRDTVLKQADEQATLKLAERDEQIEVLTGQLHIAQQSLTSERADLTKARVELEATRSDLDNQIKAAVEMERASLTAKIRGEAQQAIAIEIADRDQQLTEARAKVKEFELQELELRRRSRELEEQAEQQELELNRKIDQERQTIRQAALKQADEQAAFKLAERDQKIDALAKQLQEAQRRLEQGSPQSQGDVQEVALDRLLSEAFPEDVIERIGKGTNGGDVLQRVIDANGHKCGTILWESKRTKRWDSNWIGKAIADQQEAHATCVCIVTATLPTNIEHIGECNNVWIASWSCARSAALALRRVLIEAGRARIAADGQQTKMDLVYNYLSGPEFRNRVQGLIEPFVEMEKDLQSEMRAWHSRLKKRRKQLDRAMMSMTGLYGDLQGIVGGSLQEIEGMNLLALESQESSSEAAA